MKYNMICILDTETTSVYWNSAAPIQIAAIIVDKEGNIIDTFNERIKTTHTIMPEASEVHGIYAKDLENCRNEMEVLTDFCVWMKTHKVDCVLTYNGDVFDRPMLNERIKVYKIPYNFFDKEQFPGIDGKRIVALAKKQNLFNLKTKLGRKWKLTLVAEALGISTENAHDALGDVIMLKEVFWKLDHELNPEQ